MRKMTFSLLRAANGFRRRVRLSEAWFLLLALIVGWLAGLAALALGTVAHLMQERLFALHGTQRLSSLARIDPVTLFALPLGGALLGLMVWFGRRRTPIDVVEANVLHGGRIPRGDSLTVVGQTLVSNGFGASVGLEAAYAQAGGGLASLLGQSFNLRRNDLRTLVGAGAGASIAAAFGAPLTGAFYAFEIVIGAYTPSTIAPVMVAALVGALTARGLGVPPYLIALPRSHALHTADYVLYGVLGLGCALLGIAIMRTVSLLESGVRRSGLPDYLRPAVGGFVLIPLAAVSPQALSAGHGALYLDLASDLTIGALCVTILLKIGASTISLGFGFRGGLFFASLFIGSLVGRLYCDVLGLFPELYPLDATDAALVGMAALAVAIVGGSMTMALLVLEATHDFAITGVVIAASLIASTVVRETFGYSFSTWRLHLRGETVRSGRDLGWVRGLTARRMMRTDVPVVSTDITISEFRERYPLGSVTRVILSDPSGTYVGIVPTSNAYSGDVDEADSLASLAMLNDATLTPDLHIGEIMDRFDIHEADDLAVVDTRGRVLGVLTEKFVRRRYADELEKVQRELYGED
jgi:CIC family chloride channel protein